MTVKELKNILELVEDDSVPIYIEIRIGTDYTNVNILGIRREPDQTAVLIDADF